MKDEEITLEQLERMTDEELTRLSRAYRRWEVE
jgi:hypothetical protein